ncbi:MAG: purine-nucleoside phosphorylase [Chloroflexota bacterium]|nr:purine-nucleoside phosphorylase [Chloroflexota bacterium]MDQ5864572.1 purine-nucleoside phosphorylase [Chloroflexota bacterium]
MSELSDNIKTTAAAVRERLPNGWQPDVAIILGSGLGALADEVDAVASVPYGEIPGFVQSTVIGHAGRLVFGMLEGTRVAVMQGRVHFYEGLSLQQTTFPVRVLRELGAHTLVVTNAAGGLNPAFTPGDLMLIEDHINMLGWGGQNPLIGPNDPDLGPRFLPMDPAYDPDLLRKAREAAEECNLDLKRGVYIVLAGPNFETRAEMRALRQWGGDAVGMSTVPEVIVALHGGMKVVGISNITNMALPDNEEPVNHEDVLKVAAESGPRFIRLMKALVKRIGSET